MAESASVRPSLGAARPHGQKANAWPPIYTRRQRLACPFDELGSPLLSIRLAPTAVE